MASSNRKPQRKSGQDQARRQSAWTGARASPTYSPSPTPRPQQQQPQPSQPAFPPLSAQRTDPAQERLLTSLAGLTGTTITLRTKSGQHYEAVIASTSPEGDAAGVTLKDAKDLSTLQSKDQLFIPTSQIETWASGPADAPPPVSAPNGDTFRTDTDISQQKNLSRSRELQAWSDDLPPGLDDTLITGGRHGDDVTFGFGSSSSAAWDQFAINEKKFGITTQFDEDFYTTRIDRTGADFKERERKAQKIANEILGSTTSNPHILEERNIVDDSGQSEENKYGAVVRGQGAYVPPGARKGNVGAPTPPSNKNANTEASKAEAAKTEAPKAEVPKVSVNGPDGATVTPPKDASPAPAAAKPPADALPAFRDFVSNEKQRLNQKRMALVKNDMDKRMADLVKFSQSFKLNKPIPEDLVTILAKDENKQQAIRDKSSKDAASIGARAIGSAISTSNMPTRPVVPPSVARLDNRKTLAPVPKPAAALATTQKPTTTSKTAEASKPAGGKPLISMHIQAIPPFKGQKSKPTTPTPPTNGTANGTAAPPANVIKPSVSSTPSNSNNKLNVNASSFRPGSKGPTTTGSPGASASSSPKPKEAVANPPNPFFGAKPIKKGTPVNVKDDFNPFKHNKITEASAITALWPYTGKRYSVMFPPPQHQPQPPHAPPHIQQPPPPPYEEDTAAQRGGGYVYMYPPYAYPGQHMMPGMPPPGPPGAYMPAGPFMQAMPYPPGMPPPNMMYAQPAMGQVPPPGAYMQPPPPGAYPPPNGAGPRPSVPPTPIPAHAHPYYPQSPQLQHAMPYQMMMPPPPGAVPQHYEPGPNGHA